MAANQFWKTFEDEWFTPKHRLKKVLGQGASGAVFLAEEIVADRVMREVAIKIFASENHQQDCQVQELQTAIALKHPGLLEGFSPEQGWLKGIECLGLVMELAQGSLSHRLPHHRLPLSEIKPLVQTLASALDYLHQQGIVHCDIKPANILQVNGRWKLADFSRAQQLSQGHSRDTNPNHRLGSLTYAPPESYQGKISPAWDLWSLGILIVELLTGQHPFASKTDAELMHRVMTASPTIADDCPPPLGAIAQGCLIKAYRQRWQANQVLTALDPTAALGKVTILLPLSPSLHQILPPEATAQSYVSLPTAGVQSVILDNQDSAADSRQSASTSQPPPASRRSPRYTNYQQLLPGDVVLDMIAIPSGSFLMGTATEEIEKISRLETWFKLWDVARWLRPEMPQHRVNLASLCMSKTPITQEQWQAVMDTNPSYFSGVSRPVESVSWWDAQAFCDRLRQLTGKGYRLPTEAEWEYACRAGTQTLYSFGNRKYPLRNYAWYTWNAQQKTQPVGQKQPNPWNFHDLHGLVWEWCADHWHENYNGAPTDGRAWMKPGHASKRTVRGGCWYSLADDCRCTYLFFYDASLLYHSVGLRIVMSEDE